MKEILALLFIICFGVVTVYLAAIKQINGKICAVFFTFALSGGFVIANHDLIKRIKWKNVEIETFERSVTLIKQQAIDEIKNDVEQHKESIKLLVANANETRGNIDVQKKDIEVILARVQQAGEQIQRVASNLVKIGYVIALGAQGYGGPAEEHMKMIAEYARAIEELNPNMQEELKREFEKSGLNRPNWPKLPF
jgi:methyl-accepting chemotaxis protein